MISFVMPLPSDPRINRRVSAALHLGLDPVVFTFDRPSFKGQLPGGERIVVHRLGRVDHGKYVRRIPALIAAVARLVRARETLARSAVIYCFGPDCLAVTVLALAILRLPRRSLLVYEVADVREALTEANVLGALLRCAERAALARVDRIVVTSPRYRDAYYVAMQHRLPESISLLENKLFPPIPEPAPGPLWDGQRPIVFGYFGLLRFQEGWDALLSLARRFPDRVSIYVRGYQMGLNNFDRDIALPNVEYGGTYVSPDDLATIYGRIDALWAVYDPEMHRNLRWAIANRFYEAAHYQVPIVAAEGSFLGERVMDAGTGWTVTTATPAAAEDLLTQLTIERFRSVRAKCASLPRDFTVGDRDILKFFASLADEAARKVHSVGSDPAAHPGHPEPASARMAAPSTTMDA